MEPDAQQTIAPAQAGGPAYTARQFAAAMPGKAGEVRPVIGDLSGKRAVFLAA
jgi:hypothetical protein